jgi:hypothetical protein
MRKDIRSGRIDLERYQDDGVLSIDDFDWNYGATARRVYSIEPGDPLSAEVRIHWRKEFGRGDFHVHADARTEMRVTQTEFLITGTLEAYERQERVFSREWRCRIPRDCV